MSSGYSINDLAREAQFRWLKPAEVLFILQNYEDHQLSHQIPQKPPCGSLFLFNKRVLKFFRKDGHSWRRRKDQKTIAEAHERLKVGNAEALNCYYAHGEQNPNFQRRSFWMLDPAYDHIVLVHYRDITEGRQNSRLTSQFSPVSSSIISPSPSSLSNPQADSPIMFGDSCEAYQRLHSPGYGETSSSEVLRHNKINELENADRTEEAYSSSEPDLGQALRRIEQQLSLNEDSVKEIGSFYLENENNDLENVSHDQNPSVQMHEYSNNLNLQGHPGDKGEHHSQASGIEANVWDEVLGSYKDLPNGAEVKPPPDELVQETYNWLTFDEQGARNSNYGTAPDSYPSLLNPNDMVFPLEESLRLTIAQKQKFTIREISPDWCYASEASKVIIIGSFLCNPLECSWACMFGEIEVPVEIVQEGVIRCYVPAHLPGKVAVCITSGNRESCSEVREFEFRAKPPASMHSNLPRTENNKGLEELLLLVRFVQMLLSDSSVNEENSYGSRVDLLGKSRTEDSWSQIIEAILFGNSTSASTIDWILQELLKDKSQQWLSLRLREGTEHVGCSLSKKEQGIIHMIAGLGFEWALQPILNSGVNINFRDINGWTALHWAARFGREKMVAALVASGASAGAVTDPSPQDPTGKTPGSIAATYGHKGVAGYLSEAALTSHLSSLTLEESELSKGSAAVEAERTVNSISTASSSTNEDQLSLKDTLAAVRNAAQAAARIQSAFRAHSFRKRQQQEAEAVIAGADGDEYSILSNDIQGLSAAMKLALRGGRDYNSAALSIQKKYRGWKGRKDFLAFRQKVVKIQAHVRGYQVRKNYKVCWAVGVLEKVVLRWRRRGVGLRGFRQDMETIDEREDEDILKVFRKQKVDAAIDEAVSRVLSMVESPEARQQYHRILEKYRQAKAERETAETDTALSSYQENSYMGDEDIYQFT